MFSLKIDRESSSASQIGKYGVCYQSGLPGMGTSCHNEVYIPKFFLYISRRLFNWFAFVLFFYNGIAGVFSALLRVIMSSTFGLLLLFRVDKIVFVKGYEAYDFGVYTGIKYSSV